MYLGVPLNAIRHLSSDIKPYDGSKIDMAKMTNIKFVNNKESLPILPLHLHYCINLPKSHVLLTGIYISMKIYAQYNIIEVDFLSIGIRRVIFLYVCFKPCV